MASSFYQACVVFVIQNAGPNMNINMKKDKKARNLKQNLAKKQFFLSLHKNAG